MIHRCPLSLERHWTCLVCRTSRVEDSLGRLEKPVQGSLDYRRREHQSHMSHSWACVYLGRFDTRYLDMDRRKQGFSETIPRLGRLSSCRNSLVEPWFVQLLLSALTDAEVWMVFLKVSSGLELGCIPTIWSEVRMQKKCPAFQVSGSYSSKWFDPSQRRMAV